MLIEFVVLAALGADRCTPGSEYQPPLCPADLPAIAHVTIEQTGIEAYAGPTPPGGCIGFRPSPAEVRRFLRRARTTDIQSADATLDRSPCQARGVVRFGTGEMARWVLESTGVGMLDRVGRATQILYCTHCLRR